VRHDPGWLYRLNDTEAALTQTLPRFASLERALRHPIVHDGPAVDFFAGALLGNGALGAVVTTRPDAIVIHFGHNNVWDIRVAEDHKERISTFAEIFARVAAIPTEYERLDQDPWYREYVALMVENYSKPYPRPFPSGSLILGFDPRHAELLGHQLDIASGRCTVRMRVGSSTIAVGIFVDMDVDRLWVCAQDAAGSPVASPFERIRLLPDPDGLLDDEHGAPARMFTALASLADMTTNGAHDAGPEPASNVCTLGPRLTAPDPLPPRCLSFRQQLPFQEPQTERRSPGHPRDRAFRLTAHVSCELELKPRRNWHGQIESLGPLERALVGDTPFIACVQLDHGLESALDYGAGAAPASDARAVDAASNAATRAWATYWDCSGVALEDDLLEAIWYRNLYFFNCAVRAGATCPGLFANWSYRTIGTAWHGDYHMNYNTQQPFWVAFSSNHVDKHLAYVDLVDHLLPLSRAWACDYYGLRGAAFPHSAYPTEMSIPPYPVPTWGWEICETPWTVQSLWWHYAYTLDRDFLARRAFEPIKAAVEFLVNYMRRPEAHGERWRDDRYHIFPTVPPELYGLTPGFAKSYDCLVDLTLTRFVFRAFLQACSVLARELEEADLIAAVEDVLAHFPAYPTAKTELGTVFVSIPGEDPEIVYNVPNPAMPVFPGEELGLHSAPEDYAVAANSYRHMRVEGGNELVFGNLQGARLGLLDLERFKRQIRYCELPNGTCTDMVLQVHGRYNDTLDYDFMARMGIWFENFALPAVINECLLQSYNGTMRFFPNWPTDRRAEFRTLRAVGAFLVSAAFDQGRVQWIEIESEAGAQLRLMVPWVHGARCVGAGGERAIPPGELEMPTQAGETIQLFPLFDEGTSV
jgi:hypothetical protein